MNKKVWIGVTCLVWVVALATWRGRCERAWFAYGIAVPSCPDGELRQTAEFTASDLRRGMPGRANLRAFAHYTIGGADDRRTALPRVDSIALSLTGPKLAAQPLQVASWERYRDTAIGELTLPEVPDGDYQLHASYATPLGSGEVTAPLALYTPARIHVITDRPLYQPGNTVRFRAVALRARDLVPLDHRPGTWVIRDPDNEVLLEEAAPAGEWGVVAGSFPLDKAAKTGAWKVAWRSADAIDEVPFTVEPFTLPRFRVDATADRPFYRAGDRPSIKGAVIYSSGAPVAAATVEIDWEVNGDWPPPLEWQAHLLPRRAVTSASGRFDLALPPIPDDLQGQATLTARISAVDPAGDRATGAATVLLSKDGIQASAVTELGDGLVENFNNRLYLRVSTPDGRVVANTRLTVKRAWLPGDRGVEAQLDEDGVASLQIDPGSPVNIVIPPAPWRPAPRPALVARSEPQELISGHGASLSDQVELDRWLSPLGACARWVEGPAQTVQLALRVAASGAVLAAGAAPSALERCVVTMARARRLPAGAERLYTLELQFTDPDLPRLVATTEIALAAPAGLAEAFSALARTARDCLPSVEGRLASMLTWRVSAGDRAVEITGWIPDPTAAGGQAAMACVTSRIARGSRIALADPAASDAMGLVRFGVELPASVAQHRPQPTTMLGYELEVIAGTDGSPSIPRGALSPAPPAKPVGSDPTPTGGDSLGSSTRLRVPPGTVPDLRLRVTPVLARPGESIAAQLIRGPRFAGQLPDKLMLDCLKQHGEAVLDKDRRATLALAGDAEGWCTVAGGGVRALVYVRPRAELTVAVTPGRDRYAPGDRAELAIQTTLGGVGGAAAVGLFGVDDSLGQLVPLPGADALGRVRPKVETSAPAFGVLDGQALTLGRIRGANAAAATVLRVSSIPTPPELDAVVGTRAESRFDPIEELTDRFYLVLAELHAQVRQWEATAPEAEKMTPATMARLWNAALDACAGRGQRVDDAYGRRMRLWRLPPDLLSLTDPRAVVVVATRLTEDVENWPAWVQTERP
jgi:hypothetical protein